MRPGAALTACAGFLRWYSRLYRNQGSLFFRPARFDWGEQIVVVTGGASGIGELIANTLAVRNVTVAVLDVNPIETENCASQGPRGGVVLTEAAADNISYYKCDVSKYEEVQAAAKKIQEEVRCEEYVVSMD